MLALIGVGCNFFQFLFYFIFIFIIFLLCRNALTAWSRSEWASGSASARVTKILISLNFAVYILVRICNLKHSSKHEIAFTPLLLSDSTEDDSYSQLNLHCFLQPSPAWNCSSSSAISCSTIAFVPARRSTSLPSSAWCSRPVRTRASSNHCEEDVHNWL